MPRFTPEFLDELKSRLRPSDVIGKYVKLQKRGNAWWGLSPFKPEPHLVEKLRMLFTGTLTRPLDIFDLFFHATPLILLAIKFISEKKNPAA